MTKPIRLTRQPNWIRQLTQGDFEVGEVYRVDLPGKMIDYASNEGSVLDQQLWQVSFTGERKQLSAGAGTHVGNFAPVGSAFVERQSSRMEPPTTQAVRGGGQMQSPLGDTRSGALPPARAGAD